MTQPHAPDAPASPTPPDRAAPSTPDATALTELVMEVRDLASALSTLLTNRERRERSWSTIKRTAGLIGVAVLVGIWLQVYAPMFGFRGDPVQEVVAVVPITGTIGVSANAKPSVLVPAIERACSAGTTKALLLQIDSPGGAPTDALRISEALATCKEGGRAVPVHAVVEGVGASAAYLIAAHADTIQAGRYATVGSIGAVMRAIDGGELAQRLGVRERVYASGPLKAGNSPLSPNTPEQDALNQLLVEQLAGVFADQVRELRAGKLKADAPDLFSGRVWIAADALDLGLIDGIATAEQFRKAELGSLPARYYRPQQTLQERIGLGSFAGAFAAELAAAFANPTLE